MRGERRDSNPRPPGPQPGALPAELRPPSRLQSSESLEACGRPADQVGLRLSRPARQGFHAAAAQRLLGFSSHLRNSQPGIYQRRVRLRVKEQAPGIANAKGLVFGLS